LTKINFFLPNAGNVELTLYNQLGEKVSIIARGEYSAGSHEIEFVAENLASGIYYYKLKAGSFSRIKKMILMK
jgi:flagellar hook assembly protein FlgD